MALSFQAALRVPVAIVRSFNTYGPRQSDRAIIPTLISQALSKKEICVGNTAPTRDFMYVSDTVNGIVRVGESGAAVGEEINIGTGREISIGELAGRISRILG